MEPERELSVAEIVSTCRVSVGITAPVEMLAHLHLLSNALNERKPLPAETEPSKMLEIKKPADGLDVPLVVSRKW